MLKKKWNMIGSKDEVSDMLKNRKEVGIGIANAKTKSIVYDRL